MSHFEDAVANHYTKKNLLARIFTGLEETGIDKNNLKADDLMSVDEFHIGGREATAYAVEKLMLDKKHNVIDIGCGIGGAARYIATQAECRVTGIDLTPEYISIANILTALTKLSHKVNFEEANALTLPADNETFDAALTIHVAMNIPQRAELYYEIARVLKPGATLCIFDVMKKSDDNLAFPVPWSESPETSHLVTPQEMSTFLTDAGFEIQELEDRTDFALNFFEQSYAVAKNGPAPLGIHLVLGDNASEKLKNVRCNIENDRIIPVQIIARKIENDNPLTRKDQHGKT